MTAQTAVALGLALLSTTLVNIAYVREHEAAAGLPPLSLRRPLHSLRLLLTDRGWMIGFALETGGWLLYVAALALASLALVQSIAAGGIGILAFGSARVAGRRLGGREQMGVVVSTVGLLALGISLVGGTSVGSNGSAPAIFVWLAGTAALAAVAYAAGRRSGSAAAYGVAGGLLFSIGDISIKVATQGGIRALFAVVAIGGYVFGTALLQLGYQRGAALTTAGIATLLTNALPITAGTLLLHESIPHGVLGVLRVIAFAAVVVGAILLSQPPDAPRPETETATSTA